MRNFQTIGAATFLMVAISSPANAADSYTTVGTGVSYSRGDYGEIKDTKVLAVPFSITHRTGNWKFRASLPYIRISGPGSILQTPEGRDAGGGLGGGSNSGSGSSNSGSGSSNSGSGSSNSGSGGSGGGDVVDDDDDDDNGGSPNSETGTRSGIGDLSVSALYSADLGGGFYLEPAVKVKVPTASRAKRIGTGKVDVTPSVDLVKEVDNLTFYLHGRRKFAGKPAGSNIRSTWGAGAGASVRASRAVAIGLDYDWQQSSISGRGASSEATAWTNFRLAPKLGMTLSGTKGFNKNSADYAVALAIALRL